MLEAAGSLATHPGSWRPALEFAIAGALILGGAFWGDGGWGQNRLAGLCLIAVGCLLGLMGIENVSRDASFWRTSSQGGSLRLWLVLLLLLLAHCGVAIHKLRATPGFKEVDTFTFQRDAAQTLLAGTDPYETTHQDIYPPDQSRTFYGLGVVINNRVQVGLQYPPLTLLCAVPGYLLGDVRIGFVLAILASAGFLFAAFPDAGGLLIAALLLFNPGTFIVEEFCWTEPMVWMFFCATVYAAARRPRLLPVALGLFLASKQYNILALPFLGFLLPAFNWKAYGRLSLFSVLVAGATLAPFAVRNLPALWHDLVIFHLAQPFRPDAISFAVAFPLLLKIGPLLVLGFILVCVRKAKPNPAIFAAGYATAVLLFFSTGKQAFINYYFLVCWVLVLAALMVYQTSPSGTLASQS